MARILAVDDEPDLRLLLQVSLERAGHEVVTAAEGGAVLAAVHEAEPDVIVLDLMMPGADGFAVLEALRADPSDRVRSTPVVMYTATGAPEAQARGAIEGAIRWLTKPISMDALLTAVDDALARPVADQRLRARNRALRTLARIERGGPDDGVADGDPDARRLRLSGLERRLAPPPPPPAATALPPAPADLERLTDTQRCVLAAIRQAPTVRGAATALGMTRSSLYATVRRAGRRLGVASVVELLAWVRKHPEFDLPPEGPAGGPTSAT